MSFRPLHDRIVVKRIDAEEKTKGGIIIPDTAKEKPQEGKVVSVGPRAGSEFSDSAQGFPNRLSSDSFIRANGGGGRWRALTARICVIE